MNTLNLKLGNFCLLPIAFVFTLLLPTAAQAICERPDPKLCNYFFTSDLVIRAKVRKIKNVIDPKDPEGLDGWDYYVDVIKTYRGPVFKRQIIRASNTTIRLLLLQGKEYIIFSSKYNGRYNAAGSCWGIQQVDGEPYTEKLDAEIAALKQTREASIEIEFRDQRDELAPFPKISGVSGITIRSKTANIPVTPNKSGMFSTVVPPGTYSLTMPKSIRVGTYDHSAIDYKPVKLVAGQCAQIALEKVVVPE